MNDRKIKILEAIINDYIRTAEPIGSRTIAKRYNFGISSATIRNEMSDLEDMGLIIQPHTSSGRVPSDLGYRLYVDSLMHHRPLTEDETISLQRMIMKHLDRDLMREIAKKIAYLTQYATIVSESAEPHAVIKYVQLMPIDDHSILIIVVTEIKSVKNKPLNLDDPPDYDTLAQLARLLNAALHNKTIKDIDKPLISALLAAFGPHAHLLIPILGVIEQALQADNQTYTSGVNNFLAFPEFADPAKVQSLLRTIEEGKILSAHLDEYGKVQITIGRENETPILQECSVVRTAFPIHGKRATIGIIGPTRMDYSQVVSVAHAVLTNLNAVLTALKK
ncbi:MAG: heat-inducible transcriptional repressor HrcA [Turicibacter sp.]|nr:heat-inducible transcriptional repressor HrcA [Turicibacter sp.]